MTTYAVTGHTDLTEASTELVRDALRGLFAGPSEGGPSDGGLVGVSCIARGADSLFAEAVLDAGGRLVVVLPSRDYREAEVKPDDAPVFDRLMEAAAEVVLTDHETAGPAAYQAANTAMLARADRLIAVWDGAPPSGPGGGTADAVLEARAAGMPVRVIWPEGARRSG